MKASSELRDVVNQFVPRLRGISDEEFALKPNPIKWSKKEVLGHLIDSAHNNYRRFITSQYESTPPKIYYEQEFWVIISGYQQMAKEDVITLWRLMNERICAVLENTSEERLRKEADTGKNEVQLHSIEWLATDYVKHMKHHLNQIFKDAFDVIYP